MSIAARIFRLSFGLYIIVAILLTAGLVVEDYVATRATIGREIEIYQRAFGGAIAGALWSMDTAKLDAIAGGIVAIPEITGVRITDPATGHVFLTILRAGAGADRTEAGWVARVAATGVIRRAYPIVYASATGAQTIGRIEWLTERPAIMARARETATVIVGVALAKEAVLWLIFLAVSRIVLARPLRELIGAVNAANPEDSAPIAVGRASSRWIAGTELALIRDSFNHLLDRVTESRRRLISLNQELEREGAERSRALDEARAKSRFLAVMSHEIRTPLNAVLGFADLLERGALTGEQRRFVMLQRQAGQDLLATVNDILDLSKLDADQLRISPVPVELRRLLAECQALFAVLAEQKGLALTVVPAPELPPWLSLDPHRLRQVLGNLLGNAIKFTVRGGVTLAATLTPDSRLRIVVRDTGIGIAPDKLARLFEPYSQTESDHAFGGTGLGLVISRRLVRLMGGDVTVDSRSGEGSSFTVDLPAIPAAPDAGPVRAATAARMPPRATRILVAEDVDVNRMLIAALLQSAGYGADIVGTGAAALAAVTARPYDIVLMDIWMPEMDGMTATRRIRALPGPAGRIPVIALTAGVLPEELAACRAAGMDGHVAKPFTLAQLLAGIDAALTGAVA